MKNDFLVRDLRNGDWFWVHKIALERISKEIGSKGIAVYNWLAYFSKHEDETCYPSINLLAEKCQISRSSCIRALKQLCEISVIRKEEKKGSKNMYYLLKAIGFDTSTCGDTTPVPVVTRVSPLDSNNNNLLYNKQEESNNTVVSLKKRETAALVKFFTSEWENKFKKKYPISWGRDSTNAKEMLRQYSIEELTRLIKVYLSKDDKFIRDNGYSFGIFRTRLPVLLSGGVDNDSPKAVLDRFFERRDK